MVRRAFLSALAFLAAVAAADPAFAQRGRDRHHDDDNWRLDQRGDPRGDPRGDRGDPRERDDRGQQQREVPLSSILRDIGRQYGGRQLDSSRQGNKWIIAWVTQDGRRLTIEADAITGRIISTR